MKLLTDNELISQIQCGNKACANELIERYYPAIFRYCLWHCFHDNQAEDLVQETFFRVFRDISSYECRGNFKSYLYTIAHHLCIDANRKHSTGWLDENLPTEDSKLKQVEDREQIAYLLNLLTPVQREAILLRYGEQLSFKEIAQILDIPPRTVQSRVRSALLVLRKEKN